MKKKIILDCDPGMDDSMAIVMAAKSALLNLLAVTTLNGNYPADVTAKNALKVVEMLGIDIPVAKGMSEPMVRPSPQDPFTHGRDGQANINLQEPERRLSPLHAVDLIIRLVRENPGEVSLVCTAPLSNVAMAMKLAPDIKPLIKEIIAISGSFGLNQAAFLNATGDTPQSEWNVYVDPEAAKIVYESGVPFKAIGLDVATFFSVDFSDDDISRLKGSERREAKFLSNAIDFVRGRGYKAYCTCIDCMAVAYAIDNSLIRFEKCRVGIETKDGLTLGMTVRDGRHHHVWQDLEEIEVAVDADYRRFLDMLVSLSIE